MRSVHLHGSLGARFGTKFDLEVNTAGEALRALFANFPEMMTVIRDGAWRVVRGDVTTGIDLTEDDVTGLSLGRANVHIIPVVAGAKDGGGGFMKAILGVALIGAAFAFSGGALMAPIMSTGLLSGVTWGNVAMIGVAAAMVGVSALLSPEESSKDDNEASFLMSGPNNMGGQGSAVSLVYGELITGTVPVSAGVSVENIPVNSGSSTGGKGSSGLFGGK